MSRVVVFGSNGFIGSNLIAELVKQSDNKIIAFDRLPESKKGPGHLFSSYQNVEIIAGDFLNRNEVADVLNEGDYVFHLISTTNPATSNDDPYIDIDTNIRGSVELFESCVAKKVKKVIFLSSGGTVYGDIITDKINESTVPEPRSPYGIGKLTIENYLRYFNFASGLEYVIYRAANPYGPGQKIHGKQGVIPIFMHKFLAKEPLTIYGDGSMVRDYIYIDDLITMMVGSYDKENKYPMYNLGSGEGVSVNQIIGAIEACTNHSTEKTHLKAPSTFIHKSVLDTKRFTEEFNIKPTIDLKEGVARTWDYVKTIS